MLADYSGMNALIMGAMAQAIAWHLDDAFLNGDGAGKPAGVLTNPALIAIAAESGQAADTNLYANMVKMLSRLAPESWPTAVWVAS